MDSSGDDRNNPGYKFARKIRSFVHRESRMSARQKLAIKEHFPTYGIEYSSQALELDDYFQRDNDKVLEIGFGMGDSLAKMAMDKPDKDYIGIEVHRPGVGTLLALIAENNIQNIRIIRHDAVEVLQHGIHNASLSAVNIFFPDPWRKKKHHKRRLIQTAFIELLAKKMKPGAKLHIATDWENYAEWIDNVMSKQSYFALANINSDNNAVNRPSTKFEKRGIELGHDVWDKIYIKKP